MLQAAEVLLFCNPLSEFCVSRWYTLPMSPTPPPLPLVNYRLETEARVTRGEAIGVGAGAVAMAVGAVLVPIGAAGLGFWLYAGLAIGATGALGIAGGVITHALRRRGG